MSQTKNLALQKQESLKVVHGEEGRFLEAIKEKSIRELSEVELRQALKYAMVKIGLRAANWPEGVEKSLLLQHVWENFGDLTPGEIRIAFDWAIEGRFSVEINCYENFSCKYVSDILRAYKHLKNKTVFVEEKPMIEYKPDPSEIEKEFEAFKNNPDNKRFFHNGESDNKQNNKPKE